MIAGHENRSAMLLVVTDDGRLLLHLREDRPGVVHPGCWAGFGGGLESGETPLEAVKREMREETGVEVDDPIYLVDVVDHEGNGRLVSLFYVVGGIEQGDIVLTEGDGIGVHAIEDLAELRMTPFVSRVIETDLAPALAARASRSGLGG
jgi:8-oxo-dGTP diphosphatase